MKSILYKGHFNQGIPQLFKQSWEEGSLLIFLPPHLDDYRFIERLPAGELEFAGELWGDLKPDLEPQGPQFSETPVAAVFSSGTTKKSRLVFYSKKNLTTSVEGIYGLFDQNSFSTIFCYPQPYHTFGLTLGLAGSYLLNKNILFAEGPYSRETHRLWHQVSGETLTLGTPTHFKDLIQWTREKGIEPRETDSCIIGGARVEKNLWFTLRDELNIKKPSIGYGATEASPGVTHLPPGQEPQEDGEVGYPLKHVQWEITPEGLTFSGSNLCLAILEEDEYIFPQSFTLPDLIQEHRRDGVWIYQTRLNWFLNRGGEKFSLEKMENDIRQNLGYEVLTFKIPCPRLGEDLGMLVKTENPEAVLKILTLLKKTTMRSFNSDCFLVVKDLPRNASEKTDRIAAQKLFLNHLEIRKDLSDSLYPGQSDQTYPH